MCGIFGIFYHQLDNIIDRTRLEETARLLHHRGPDSYGIYTNKNIGLVHTRLSLVDISHNSDQPFWDKQKRYCLVYNGEVYNFPQLKKELKASGIEFKTSSDTEVILEAILQWGIEKTLPRLEGMFAFAWYDTETQTLILARDRFGIKPLLIYEDRDVFLFASEIQAFQPWIDLKPDFWSISSYLQGFDGATQGKSFFEKVKFVPPATVIKLGIDRTVESSKFFALKDFYFASEAQRLDRLKPRQLIDLVDEYLSDSVNSQMFADAPVGALCSGGVDSSVIVAMAAMKHNNLAIFHANVVGVDSEYDAAIALAKHLKLDLQTVEICDRDFIELMPTVTEHYGYPFSRNPHSIPFLKVCELVRTQGVKAVLSGEGSDECFLGYSWFTPNLTQWRKKPLQGLKQLLKKIIKSSPAVEPYWRTLYLGNPNLVKDLHNRFEVSLEGDEIRQHFQQQTKGDYRSQIYSLDLLNYNLRALLHRNDTMGMSASIESRFPFLDSNLVRLAINLPYQSKIRLTGSISDRVHPLYEDKWILRQVADRYLPKSLSRRPKKPFTVNAFERFKFDSSLFKESFIQNLFGLSSPEVDYLLSNADPKLKLRLLHLDVWGDLLIRNITKAEITERLKKYIEISV